MRPYGSSLLAAALAASGLLLACEEVTVTSVAVATVAVEPASATVRVGETLKLAADLRAAGGQALMGRSIQWSSDDPDVALVAADGSVIARRSGTVAIRARVESAEGTSLVQVLDASPELLSDRQALTFELDGGSQTTNVLISEPAGTTVTGLDARVVHEAGGPGNWLTATLSSDRTPSILSLTANASAMPAGTFSAFVEVIGTGVQPLSLPVTLIVTASGPRIELGESQVRFEAGQGGTNPDTRRIGITNGGTGTLDGLASTVSYPQGGPTGWLVASVPSGAAPTDLVLSAITGALPAGEHQATVAVTSPSASNSPQTVSVVFSVTAQGPVLHVNPLNLAFSGSAGGASPAPRSVAITNRGSGVLTGISTATSYSPGQASGWLGTSLSATTAPATLTVTPQTAGLPAGSYQASIEVVSAGAQNSPTFVTVSLTLGGGAPSIVLSPTTVSFSGQTGGGDPTPATVSVSNGGAGTLSGLSVDSVVYSGAQGWLSTSLSSGTAPTTLQLTPTLTGVAAGSHGARVFVGSSAAGVTNAPQVVDVSFSVTVPPPTIGLSPSTASFQALVGGGDPSVGAISVTNTGAGSLTGLSVDSITYQGASGWLQASLSSSSAPATLTLEPRTGSTGLGSHTARVWIGSSAQGVTNSPQSVQVTFDVLRPPAIAVADLAPSLSVFQGGVVQVLDLAVTNGGDSVLTGLSEKVDYPSGSPKGWLSARFVGGTTAPTTLRLEANPSGLALGNYTALVELKSGVASNSPVTVVVSLAVTPPPAIQLDQSSVLLTAVGAPGLPFRDTVDVQVTNSGGGLLTLLSSSVTYGSGSPGWLTASFTSLTAPTTLRLIAGRGGRSPGSYSAQVSVDAPGAVNGPQVLQVDFQIDQPPSIGVDDASKTFIMSAGGSNPGNQAIVVSNNGGGTLTSLTAHVTAYQGGASGWLTATLDTSAAPATLTLSVDGTGVPAGSYEATVELRSPVADNTPVTVKAFLVVN